MIHLVSQRNLYIWFYLLPATPAAWALRPHLLLPWIKGERSHVCHVCIESSSHLCIWVLRTEEKTLRQAAIGTSAFAITHLMPLCDENMKVKEKWTHESDHNFWLLSTTVLMFKHGTRASLKEKVILKACLSSWSVYEWAWCSKQT